MQRAVSRASAAGAAARPRSRSTRRSIRPRIEHTTTAASAAARTTVALRARRLVVRASGGESEQASVVDDYFAADKRPIILFDGVCNLCNGGVNLALDLDPPGNLRFAALQSPAGRRLLARAGRDPSDISSIVLVVGKGEGRKGRAKGCAHPRVSARVTVCLMGAGGEGVRWWEFTGARSFLLPYHRAPTSCAARSHDHSRESSGGTTPRPRLSNDDVVWTISFSPVWTFGPFLFPPSSRQLA